MEGFELANKFFRERQEALDRLEKNLKIIAERAKKMLKAKVYVFGSYVEGNFKPFWSDVDVLIVCKKLPKKMRERVKIKSKLKEKLKGAFVFQIHLVDEAEAKWYEFFVRRKRRL